MTDFKLAYDSANTLSCNVASLATSSGFTGGYESAAFDNSSTKFPDVRVSGYFTVGTTPTINTQIRIYVVETIDGTLWPDVFDGTESAETVTSLGVLEGFAKLAQTLSVDATTSDRTYPFSFNVSPLFMGAMPDKFALFVTHNTGVNLNSTSGNHVVKTRGLYATIA